MMLVSLQALAGGMSVLVCGGSIWISHNMPLGAGRQVLFGLTGTAGFVAFLASVFWPTLRWLV